MSGLVIPDYPLQYLKDYRSRITLVYRNDEDFDYALGPRSGCPPTLPWCIEQWAHDGLVVDESFVERLWQENAKKENGKKKGEIVRCTKLALDAFIQLYHIAATRELTGCPVSYSAAEDMQNVDLSIFLPMGRVKLQLAIRVFREQDYFRLDSYDKRKAARRTARGEVEIAGVVNYMCGGSNLDDEYDFMVPKDEWYAAIPQHIKMSQGQQKADEMNRRIESFRAAKEHQ